MYSFKSESNEIDITAPLLILSLEVAMQEKWHGCALPASSNCSLDHLFRSVLILEMFTEQLLEAGEGNAKQEAGQITKDEACGAH